MCLYVRERKDEEGGKEPNMLRAMNLAVRTAAIFVTGAHIKQTPIKIR
jgi:hypothetical protein